MKNKEIYHKIEVKGLKRQVITWIIVAIILAILLIGLTIAKQRESSYNEISMGYYREQMLNFCELSELDLEADSNLYPCEKWLLENILNES